jgi:hypothetical protein
VEDDGAFVLEALDEPREGVVDVARGGIYGAFDVAADVV